MAAEGKRYTQVLSLLEWCKSHPGKNAVLCTREGAFVFSFTPIQATRGITWADVEMDAVRIYNQKEKNA